MEESKELQGFYKIFRAVIYISVLLEFFEYVIDPAICKGCTKCARNCPAGAITGELKKPHHIDTDKCIKCGTCKTGCPFGAIKEA